MFTSLLLKPLKQCLIDVTSFRPSKLLHSRSIPLKCTNKLLLFLQIIWITKFMRQNSQHTSALSLSLSLSIYLYLSLCLTLPLSLCPPVHCFSCDFKFSFDTQNITFVHPCSHVFTQPVSPNYRGRKIEGKYMCKVNYLWDLHPCEMLYSMCFFDCLTLEDGTNRLS